MFEPWPLRADSMESTSSMIIIIDAMHAKTIIDGIPGLMK